MNAMAAMYHIAQKDPPTLKEPNQWCVLCTYSVTDKQYCAYTIIL